MSNEKRKTLTAPLDEMGQQFKGADYLRTLR